MNELEASTGPVIKAETPFLGREKHLVSVSPLTLEPFRLSLTEETVCEVLAETGSMKEVRRVVLEKYRRNIRPLTVERWIRTRPLVKAKLMELMERKGQKMSEDEWEANVARICRNDTKINKTTAMMYKLYAEKKGWMKEEKQTMNFSGRDIRVNILQKNGEA